MSKTLYEIKVAATVEDYEHLPLKDGEQMFSDDVRDELVNVVDTALQAWYRHRGSKLLACEPDVF